MEWKTLFLVVVAVLASLDLAQGAGNPLKRENQGFYTTRFGRRSDPSMPNAHFLRPEQPSGLERISRSDYSKVGASIEGYDDQGRAVHCVSTGSKGLYVCQKETEDNWVLMN